MEQLYSYQPHEDAKMSGSNPGWVNGTQPTPTQWNQEWSLKADYTQAFPTPLPIPTPVSGISTLPFAVSGNIFYQGVLSASITFDLSGGAPGQQMVLVAQQSLGGGDAISFGSGILWSGGVVPVPATGANIANIFHFYPSGTTGIYFGIYFGSSSSAPTSVSPNFFALF